MPCSSFFNAAAGDLTGVYPSEIFSSELRASGIGLAAAASRLGAAAGTFLLPIGISHIGVGASVLIGAAVCAVGAFVSHVWAPETTGLSLTKTGQFKPVGVQAAERPQTAG
ncbi:MAG: MFS transporter [Solirubrobacteraceae bacterium]